jgi:ribosomal-protein-alanine N-acetyltransferase
MTFRSSPSPSGRPAVPDAVLAEALEAGRLRLLPLSADALEALAARDGPRFHALTGLVVPDDVRPPPLMEDALPFVSEQVRTHRDAAAWWMWAIAAEGAFVGSIGFAGLPDQDGVVQIGYSVYPERQGQGIATEALEAMTAWAFSHPTVRLVRATIPPWNVPSLRVAGRVGYVWRGRAHDDEVGEVHVYEKERP